MRLAALFAAMAFGLSTAAGAAALPSRKDFLPKSKPKKYDLNALRAEVDETLAVLDVLARESRLLTKTAKASLVEALKTEYQLEDRRAQAAQALEEAEAVLGLQEAVKAQERLLAGTLAPAERDEALKKLRDLKEDLEDEIQGLRLDLGSLHKSLNEEQTRNFRNWAMVSGGMLKRAREREGQASAVSSGAKP